MEETEINELVGGAKLRTHARGQCVGEYCTIHNHSDHHMVKWKQYWRSDLGIMERICPHGVGHPDPDDPKAQDPTYSSHGCDRCCLPSRVFDDDYVELIHTYNLRQRR